MKRTIFWLLVSIFTFALGVAIVFVWLDRQKSIDQQSETISSPVQKTDVPRKLPILTYCELANNPEKYNGEVVRVRTKLNQFIHRAFFVDENCSGRGKTTAVVFNPERADEIINKLESDTKSEKFGFWGAEVIALGKFSRVNERKKVMRQLTT